jgi:hypothetical protein
MRVDYSTRTRMGRGRNRRRIMSMISKRRQMEVARKRRLSYRKCRAIRTIRHCKAQTRYTRRVDKHRIV